eukprot:12699904-Alexandrium_andersonii.AAC.1
MSASLVGSEMCIRDRAHGLADACTDAQTHESSDARTHEHTDAHTHRRTCLLYTSDAADDM